VGGLAQEFSRFQIENAIVRGAAIPAHQIPPRRLAMFMGFFEQFV